ncbi:MAG: hypothetical protein A2Z29_07090 [Chloroflexi bacterium RBG_16_56_11]|nr:MAG: hypothetical protein A2Z29_07090 [Chloroflexi bacterium RBG_16_56_11]
MISSRCKVTLALLIFISIALAFAGACAVDDSFDAQFENITSPYRFSLFKWEVGALFDELRGLFQRRPDTTDGTADVIKYFANAESLKRLEAEGGTARDGNGANELFNREDEADEIRQGNARLANKVEMTLESQIRAVLTEEEIYNPLLRLKFSFPPVSFSLGQPPNLLVVSPRDRIERWKELTLEPEMSIDQMEDIERKIDEYQVSSLIVELGGIATFPAFLSDRNDLLFVLQTAAEEWAHQYLAFTPLGFRYVLDLAGINRNDDIVTMNETVAGIAGKEIGRAVYRKYYGRDETIETGPDDFFNQEMRDTRRTVDEYLARGEIERAETYMEQQRQYLAENGYYIRKLNQAYFAFHGSYADSPTSISPIGADIRRLRDRSASIKEFLDTAAAMTGVKDLTENAR